MLKIQTTGLEQYAPGGSANLKSMIIGGPGAGKTRMGSFWPKPIYANCEGGLASVADRQVPYVDVNDSGDMLEFLKHMKIEASRPERRFETVVVDTLDTFQRKVKDEWIRANNAASFGGFEAWGYLDAKMQMLMTRLLNLDMNVLVLVHYKDKQWTEGKGDNKVERHELMLQLQGDIKDSAFNDFDLVGWLGTFWKSDEDLNRVQARGLTFQPTPDRPFLKDRLFVTPEWIEVHFGESDYTQLFEAFTSRLDELEASREIGELEPLPDDSPISGDGVVKDLTGGPVPPQTPQEMPLDQLKKPELIAIARDMPEIKDQVKSNMLKSEIVSLIQTERQRQAEAPGDSSSDDSQSDDSQSGDSVKHATQQPESEAESPPAPSTDVQTTPDGDQYDPATGEVLKHGESDTESAPQTAEEAAENVKEGLGGEVISGAEGAEGEAHEEPSAQQAPEAASQSKGDDEEKVCQECGKSLADENADYVKLGWIKLRKFLCNDHYLEAKKKATKS